MDEGEFACPLGPTVRLTARPPERLFRLVLESHHGRAPGADSEEKHEPASDIDTVAVDSLKALDPEWPIREADTTGRLMSLARTCSPARPAGPQGPHAGPRLRAALVAHPALDSRRPRPQ